MRLRRLGLLCLLGPMAPMILACPHRIAPQEVARCASGIRLDPDVSPPKASHRVYPKTRRLSGTELFACLEVTVNADGSVSDVAVVERRDVEFDDAAVQAVRQWQYLPARRNGQPIPVRMRVIVYNYRPPTF